MKKKVEGKGCLYRAVVKDNSLKKAALKESFSPLKGTVRKNISRTTSQQNYKKTLDDKHPLDICSLNIKPAPSDTTVCNTSFSFTLNELCFTDIDQSQSDLYMYH